MTDRATPPIRPEDVSDEHAGTDPTLVDAYVAMTDTVTGLSLRPKDNIMQLGVVVVGAGVAALVGYLGWGLAGAALGAGAGAMVGLLISGAIIGINRLLKRLRR